MIDHTKEYALKVFRKQKLVGRSEYLACKRFLDDLENNEEYYFDVEEAEKAISIANELTILEGEQPQKLTTRGFQNFIIGNLHGWKRKDNDTLRFREAYIQMGRQNGKSFLSGTEANYRATFSGYMKGRIFCTATKQDQANIVWDEIEKFIISDKNLQELYMIRKHERTITSLITGTVIKSIGRDTKSADGFRTILAIVDEYHAHPTNQMYKLAFDGQINVPNALTLAITTAGFNLNSDCFKQYEFAKQILEGVIKKDSLFIYIAEMDKDDDIWDYHNWAKANPFLLWNDDDTYNMEKVRIMSEKAIDAKEKGGEELLNFLTKSLNTWVQSADSNFINLEQFKKCQSDLKISDMEGKKAYLGIDLSSGGDLTSIALIFPLENEKVYVYSHSFMPKLRLEEHEKTDDAPYRIWVKQNLLTLTEGAFSLKTDYKFIIAHLKGLIERYSIEIIGCAYDPHNAGAFISDLDFLNCDLTEITQSAKSLNDATVDLQLSIEANQMLYDKDNELLKWSFVNAKLTHNSFGEIKIEKEQNKFRIDPVDAVVDAWKLFINERGNIPYNAEDDFDEWLNLIGGDNDGEI